MHFIQLYIDPSIMSYTIQIIVGAVITLGAVIGIIWRKAKKKVKTTFNIDENKNKEIEEEVKFTDNEA